jgi:hypothetical protein
VGVAHGEEGGGAEDELRLIHTRKTNGGGGGGCSGVRWGRMFRRLLFPIHDSSVACNCKIIRYNIYYCTRTKKHAMDYTLFGLLFCHDVLLFLSSAHAGA